ncbi:MAG: GNAT family N-acetyltransferase [Nostocaceae cyanobacterium]|nr:GNAT family N-acetyltransferase [Nostocaceae cyanobacterium]
MNFYSDDSFCQAFGAAYFPNQQIQPALFELEGRLWKIPTIDYKKPIVTGPFIDFYESDEQSSKEAVSVVKKVDYIPRVSHKLVTTNEWFENNLETIYEPAPTIIWNNFDSWDEFVKHVKQKRSNLFSDTRRRQRKMEKEVGPLTFVFDDRRADVLAACMGWKSEQYRMSGYIDAFAYEEHVRFFQELVNRDLLLVSSLSAGDKLIAVHLGVLLEGRLYWWIPAYDSNYKVYSPGRLLLELLLNESFQLNHKEFDFMIGDEPYKWYYATHTRLIKEMGTPPISLRLQRSTKAIMKPILSSAIRPFPGLKKSLKDIQKKVQAKLYQVTK